MDGNSRMKQINNQKDLLFNEVISKIADPKKRECIRELFPLPSEVENWITDEYRDHVKKLSKKHGWKNLKN